MMCSSVVRNAFFCSAAVCYCCCFFSSFHFVAILHSHIAHTQRLYARPNEYGFDIHNICFSPFLSVPFAFDWNSVCVCVRDFLIIIILTIAITICREKATTSDLVIVWNSWRMHAKIEDFREFFESFLSYRRRRRFQCVDVFCSSFSSLRFYTIGTHCVYLPTAITTFKNTPIMRIVCFRFDFIFCFTFGWIFFVVVTLKHTGFIHPSVCICACE